MPPRKTAKASEAAELNVAVRQLTEEVRVLRQAVDEFRDDVVWAARQVLDAGYQAAGQTPPTPRDPLAPDADCQPPRAEAAETADENLYCCSSPRLAWHGSPEAPGVACQNCGYLIADEGNILIWRDDTDEETAAGGGPEVFEHQERLFE